MTEQVESNPAETPIDQRPPHTIEDPHELALLQGMFIRYRYVGDEGKEARGEEQATWTYGLLTVTTPTHLPPRLLVYNQHTKDGVDSASTIRVEQLMYSNPQRRGNRPPVVVQTVSAKEIEGMQISYSPGIAPKPSAA